MSETSPINTVKLNYSALSKFWFYSQKDLQKFCNEKPLLDLLEPMLSISVPKTLPNIEVWIEEKSVRDCLCRFYQVLSKNSRDFSWEKNKAKGKFPPIENFPSFLRHATMTSAVVEVPNSEEFPGRHIEKISIILKYYIFKKLYFTCKKISIKLVALKFENKLWSCKTLGSGAALRSHTKWSKILPRLWNLVIHALIFKTSTLKGSRKTGNHSIHRLTALNLS